MFNKFHLKSCTALIPLILSTSAFASLGGPSASVEADKVGLKATQAVSKKAVSKSAIAASSNQALYTIHEIQTDTGTIREFVSASDIVFGVAWTGMTHPDLESLLGSYSSDFQAADENGKTFGTRSRTVYGDHVVVERWGHMRKLEGRAYDPALLPTGVDSNDIK